MNDFLNKLIKPEIMELQPYQVQDYNLPVKLDANESPFDIPDSVKQKIVDFFKRDTLLNVYPDPDSDDYRIKLSKKYALEKECFICGNGSDEIITMITAAFAGKGDNVLCPAPSFSMYSQNAQIAGCNIYKYILDKEKDFAFNVPDVIDAYKKSKPKLLYICAPNNPTGTFVSKDEILEIIYSCPDSLIVIDEAYEEFAGSSVCDLIKKYPSLIILRTLSKAFSLAGLRSGYAIGDPDMINILRAVKSPYNLNRLTQFISCCILNEEEAIKNNINYLINEKNYLYNEMQRVRGIKVFPSSANFLLFESEKSEDLYKYLLSCGIQIRLYGQDGLLGNCMRVSMGDRSKNNSFLHCIK